MKLIDSQVHAYEANNPKRPWTGVLHGPASVTGDDMVAAMDRVGVAGALLVSPYAMYRFDASYALEVYAAHPGRFGIIKPVNSQDAAVVETIDAWAATKGTVAIRLMLNADTPTDPTDPGIDRVMKAAARHGMPINLLAWGRLDQVKAMAARHPDTVLVVDHLGMQQPFEPPVPAEPWVDLPKVLSLAAFDNVKIKISGAGTLSHQPYPYDDIWPPILQILDSYGVDRCMWGTDWTRAVAFLTYEQGVEPFLKTDRLSDGDKAALMGGTLSKVYNWTPSQ
jgi:L-fuconolactonase